MMMKAEQEAEQARNNITPRTAAVILAGGQARRLNGQNKSGLMVGSKSCLERVFESVKEPVDAIALSVGKTDRYNHAQHHEIIFDWPSAADESGAIFAVLGSLDWAKKTGYDAVITTPVDTPFLPNDYVQRLMKKGPHLRPAVCKTPEGLQGLHALWPVSCFEPLKTAVLENSIYKLSKIHKVLGSKEVTISADEAWTFLNINNEAALQAARDLALSS